MINSKQVLLPCQRYVFFSISFISKILRYLHKNLYIWKLLLLSIGKISQCVWTQLWIMCILTKCKFISDPQISWFSKNIVFIKICICIIAIKQIFCLQFWTLNEFILAFTIVTNVFLQQNEIPKVFFESIKWMKKNLKIFYLKQLMIASFNYVQCSALEPTHWLWFHSLCVNKKT